MGKVVHGVGIGKKRAKKNAGVGVDFRRVKKKVGKKLAKAQNETSVNFKSATINLPAQSVQQDKDGVAVNFQNLSLQVTPGVRRCHAMRACMHACRRGPCVASRRMAWSPRRACPLHPTSRGRSC